MTISPPPDTAPPLAVRSHTAATLIIGLVTNFFDTLGIGSFATTTAAFKLGRVVEDQDIPGTLNVGHALPTVLQAAIYITVIRVEWLTLVAMIAGGAVGAWFGAGFVVRWPRRAIQRGMAIALCITAVFTVLRLLQFFPPGGDALGLSGVALVVAVLVNVGIGSLATLGIGNYAPCMALVSLLGMNPTTAFPIMMGSAALILPAAAVRFVASGRFHRGAAWGLALGGVPGVLIAAFIVKSLPLDAVRWLVVGVLLYTASVMWLSARAEARVTGP